MKHVIVLYIPVIHEGYLRFLKNHADIETLYIVDKDLAAEHSPFAREIRAVDPEIIQSLMNHLGIIKDVRLLNTATAHELNTPETEVITADEAMSKRIAEAYFPHAHLTIDNFFLRWDEANVLSQKVPDDVHTSTDPFDVAMMQRAQALGQQSPCWWRQIGAVLVKDGKSILEEYNTHVPSPHVHYANGDPRDVTKPGTDPHIATTIHSEQALITEAARRGVSIDNTDLYVTVFPCPMCAKQVAASGIRRCFYASGHASLDGESVLRANGVELIYVDTSATQSET